MKNLILMVAVIAAYIGFLAHGEATFRDRLLAECPSGTAVRVCDEAEAALEKTTFGRLCVQFSRMMRRLGEVM